ncbi:Histone deacetylase complex subunit SAP30, Sin3 binding domain,Histone deacetylase complex subunit SAP30 [Cinara cedri]|uniref:Histone deacetylase complex subunit SAP30, Sin3 binding domain,Histone deacetylase complex subunit SAP30 n=1 Tax=Cinara cedri TaxID=506608 RepID=A0A5E4N5Q4_9HEMI|nr:Histone deacetylase complex subunit SAP30, Sin3 binding domain,Histone deacetylase complex subunit SAP30 [Cinara cedri]
MEENDGFDFFEGVPYENLCCLQENKLRCHRQAGNASYSKRIHKIVIELKLHLDNVAKHICICDYHKNMIQREIRDRNQRKATALQEKAPKVDFSQLSIRTLNRYKKFRNIETKPSTKKSQMIEIIQKDFKTIPVHEKSDLAFFIYKIKTGSNQLDQATSNDNSTD